MPERQRLDNGQDALYSRLEGRGFSAASINGPSCGGRVRHGLQHAGTTTRMAKIKKIAGVLVDNPSGLLSRSTTAFRRFFRGVCTMSFPAHRIRVRHDGDYRRLDGVAGCSSDCFGLGENGSGLRQPGRKNGDRYFRDQADPFNRCGSRRH